MSPALKKFDEQFQMAIDTLIAGHVTTGYMNRKMRIDVEEVGVVRITLKLRQDVARYGRRMNIPIEFDRNTRSFYFNLELNKVLMTANQAQAFEAANIKYRGLVA